MRNRSNTPEPADFPQDTLILHAAGLVDACAHLHRPTKRLPRRAPDGTHWCGRCTDHLPAATGSSGTVGPLTGYRRHVLPRNPSPRETQSRIDRLALADHAARCAQRTRPHEAVRRDRGGGTRRGTLTPSGPPHANLLRRCRCFRASGCGTHTRHQRPCRGRRRRESGPMSQPRPGGPLDREQKRRRRTASSVCPHPTHRSGRTGRNRPRRIGSRKCSSRTGDRPERIQVLASYVIQHYRLPKGTVLRAS